METQTAKNNVRRLQRPKTYDSRERLIEELRELIFACGRPYKDIAEDCRVSPGTVMRLAQGYTRWPRHTTLFPLLDALRVRLALLPVVS